MCKNQVQLRRFGQIAPQISTKFFEFSIKTVPTFCTASPLLCLGKRCLLSSRNKCDQCINARQHGPGQFSRHLVPLGQNLQSAPTICCQNRLPREICVHLCCNYSPPRFTCSCPTPFADLISRMLNPSRAISRISSSKRVMYFSIHVAQGRHLSVLRNPPGSIRSQSLFSFCKRPFSLHFLLNTSN